jgi:hypothetical protein
VSDYVFGETLTDAKNIEEAKYVSFGVDLTGITKDKLYDVQVGEPIGIDKSRIPEGYEFVYADEYYITNDLNQKQTEIWNVLAFDPRYYK